MARPPLVFVFLVRPVLAQSARAEGSGGSELAAIFPFPHDLGGGPEKHLAEGVKAAIDRTGKSARAAR